ARPRLPAGHAVRRGPHLPAVPGAGRRGTARTGTATGRRRPRPRLARALRALSGRRSHRRAPTGEAPAAGGAAEHRGGRPRRRTGPGRLAAAGGDVPGRPARRVGAVAARRGRRGPGPRVTARLPARPRRRDGPPVCPHRCPPPVVRKTPWPVTDSTSPPVTS